MAPSANESDVPVSLLGEGPAWFIGLLVRGRVWLLVLPLVVGIGVFAFTRANMRYVAEATIRPQSNTPNVAPLSGLAAQFGVSLPGASLGDPVGLYAELARSRRVLEQTVEHRFAVALTPSSPDSTRGSLLDLLEIRGQGEDRIRRGMDRLYSMTDVAVDRDAGLVMIGVRSEWPELSRSILRQMLRRMNELTIQLEQDRAEREREFIEGRLQEAKQGLDGAEAEVSDFLLRNRSYEGSPPLVLEYARLQRQVELRQQIYATLAQAYEQARLDEVRNTPSFGLVDPPDGPVREASRPGRDAAVWMLLSAAMVLLVVLGMDWLRRFRRLSPNAAAELSAALEALVPGRRRE